MQNETLYNSEFIHLLSDIIIITDDNWKILKLNTIARKAFKNKEEEIKGKDILDVLNHFFIIDIPTTLNYLKGIEAPGSIGFPHKIYLKKNKNKHFKLACTSLAFQDISKAYFLILSLSDEENNPPEFYNSLSLSEEQSSEGKIIPAGHILESAQKHFKRLAENSPDIIYIINVKLRKVIYFNRENILDYPKNELETSEGWIEMVHPDDIKIVKAHWNKFIKTATETDQIEYRLKRKTEEYEWVVNRHTIIERDSEGDPVHVLLNITIITERKNAEEALRESEARLLALIDNTNDIIWSVDKDLQFTALNSSFRNHFRSEFKRELKLGQNLLEILPARISVEWLKNHKRALSGERFTTEFTLNSKKRNFSYEISYNPIYSADGHISGVSVFGRDITLRKSTENDIIRTNFELDSFVYRASHDLRAPLRSVLGLINIVKTEDNIQQRNHYLNLVDKSINKLDTFISDLTNFSRNSRLEIRIEKINFHSIIEESIENLKYMENAAFIDIKKEIVGDYDFYSDAGRIAIILQNLLSNSIKYRNPKVEKPYVMIKVNISRNNSYITLEDNGKGIKEEYIDKIFNMFFRASYDSYGSGLGLYITKQVVEKLKGDISVNSTLGSGSIFEIKLPNLQKK